jgi:SAM-dependent methyltransferase
MSIQTSPRSHSHMWLVGVGGILAGLALMIVVPTLPAVSGTLFLVAGFHLLGALIALTSIRITFWNPWRRSRSGAGCSTSQSVLDFGWAPAWTLGPLLFAVVLWAMAIVIEVSWPTWWPGAFLFVLLGACAFAGHLIAKTTTDAQFAPLPMVDLLPGGRGVILDGGCGAGRTSLAVAGAFPQAELVAIDRFDSNYIQDGGLSLLTRNATRAGFVDRLKVVQGDLTAMQFADDCFDAAVSAHAMDHLGDATKRGLAEMRRVLKPGARFLLVVWVPGWMMFAVANVLSFFLRGKAEWRTLARAAGFELLREGDFNGYWYLLLRKQTH